MLGKSAASQEEFRGCTNLHLHIRDGRKLAALQSLGCSIVFSGTSHFVFGPSMRRRGRQPRFGPSERNKASEIPVAQSSASKHGTPGSNHVLSPMRKTSLVHVEAQHQG